MSNGRKPNIITTYGTFAKPHVPFHLLILGIETSCDETGVALYDSANGQLTHRLHSQIEMHAAYGGVVPELASRDHIRRLIPLIEEVIKESVCSLNDIDAIAVTQGPGLGGALLVGTSVAAGLGTALGKPVIGIHHLEGHLLSPLLSEPRPDFPFVALLVSGGHTQLMAVEGVGSYRLLGETVDDAAGEAFDKTASLLGLSYPGGPALSKLAEKGTSGRFKLPRPMIASGDLNFSFSGLKTAAQVLKRKLEADNAFDHQARADIAAAFQASIVEVLVAKSLAALNACNMTRLVVAGGVGANSSLRQKLNQATAKSGQKAYYPPLDLCTDNGAMIAFAAAMRLAENPSPLENSCASFNIKPRWALEEISAS